MNKQIVQNLKFCIELNSILVGAFDSIRGGAKRIDSLPLGYL